MRLLVCTQVVDTEDSYLGFVPAWIEGLAERTERTSVICLKKGNHALPADVVVHSLGKERGVPSFKRLTYGLRFLTLAWRLRHTYDVVLVHMNQEYVLLAGWMWRLLGKRVYLWRNHYAGSWLTGLAVFWTTKVFYTSHASYTASYPKAVRMPVGVQIDSAVEDQGRRPHSILFLGRMAPSKNPHLLLEALHALKQEGVPFTATFVGSPLPEHEAYYESLTQKAADWALLTQLSFVPGVPHEAVGTYFRSHEIFVNLSASGMYDKTLFEAAAAGTIVLARSEDFREIAGDTYAFSSVSELTERLRHYLIGGIESTEREHMRALAASQALPRLLDTLVRQMA